MSGLPITLEKKVTGMMQMLRSVTRREGYKVWGSSVVNRNQPYDVTQAGISR